MAETVNIPNADQLLPGQTVRLDFSIPSTNRLMVEETAHAIKRAVYSDDRFDFQGAKTQILGDTTLGRDITMLSVYVTVRKTRRETHQEIQYANMSTLEALIRSAPEALGFGVKHFASRVLSVAEAVKDGVTSVVASPSVRNFSWAAVAIAGVLVYWFFLGVPRHSRD